MTEEIRREMGEIVKSFHLPRYRELPDVGLYLEQVTRYVNRFTPNPLTSSMVSNYVKQHIVPGPEKKAYGRDAIAYLIFMTYIKMVSSLEDIRQLVNIQQNSYSVMVAYDYFCEEMENLLQYVYGVKKQLDDVGHDHTEQRFLLRTALLSVAYKMYLDHCLHYSRNEGKQELFEHKEE